MKNPFVKLAISMMVIASAPAAFAAEAKMSGVIDIQVSNGLPKQVPMTVSVSIVPGDIQEIDWWMYTDCVGGRDREGDCLEYAPSYWSPVVKVALQTATFSADVGGSQFQLPSDKPYGVIGRGCFENEESLRIYGDTFASKPKFAPAKIVVKKGCGISVEAIDFVTMENFLGRPGVVAPSKAVFHVSVVPANSENIEIINGGVNDRGMFATGGERIRIPPQMSWFNLSPIYIEGRRLTNDSWMTYLEPVKE